VLLNGTALPAASVVSVTGTQIVFTAPAHAAGSVTVTVKVSGTPLPGSVTYRYGSVAPDPGVKPSGGTGGSPNHMPGARPQGATGQTGGTKPNSLPAQRP
jgi:hypothetical protein